MLTLSVALAVTPPAKPPPPVFARVWAKVATRLEACELTEPGVVMLVLRDGRFSIEASTGLADHRCIEHALHRRRGRGGDYERSVYEEAYPPGVLPHVDEVLPVWRDEVAKALRGEAATFPVQDLIPDLQRGPRACLSIPEPGRRGEPAFRAVRAWLASLEGRDTGLYESGWELGQDWRLSLAAPDARTTATLCLAEPTEGALVRYPIWLPYWNGVDGRASFNVDPDGIVTELASCPLEAPEALMVDTRHVLETLDAARMVTFPPAPEGYHVDLRWGELGIERFVAGLRSDEAVAALQAECDASRACFRTLEAQLDAEQLRAVQACGSGNAVFFEMTWEADGTGTVERVQPRRAEVCVMRALEGLALESAPGGPCRQRFTVHPEGAFQ